MHMNIDMYMYMNIDMYMYMVIDRNTVTDRNPDRNKDRTTV
jgi:hypothetical protein